MCLVCVDFFLSVHIIHEKHVTAPFLRLFVDLILRTKRTHALNDTDVTGPSQTVCANAVYVVVTVS